MNTVTVNAFTPVTVAPANADINFTCPDCEETYKTYSDDELRLASVSLHCDTCGDEDSYPLAEYLKVEGVSCYNDEKEYRANYVTA